MSHISPTALSEAEQRIWIDVYKTALHCGTEHPVQSSLCSWQFEYAIKAADVAVLQLRYRIEKAE